MSAEKSPMAGASGHCLTRDHERCAFKACTCPHHKVLEDLL